MRRPDGQQKMQRRGSRQRSSYDTCGYRQTPVGPHGAVPPTPSQFVRLLARSGALHAVLKEMPLDVLRWFAELSEEEDEREQALHFLNVASRLDPDDADIAAKLRSIQVS
jgi:hypothetical protein